MLVSMSRFFLWLRHTQIDKRVSGFSSFVIRHSSFVIFTLERFSIDG
jgi:hypothetical protein